MKKIIFSALFSFLYLFGNAQTIWFEGFEGAAFPPAGWNIIDISGTKTWEKGADYAHSGNSSAEHGWLAGSVQATALVTPPITIPNYGTPKLDFWSRIQLVGYNNSSRILISTTVNNDINAFTLVKILQGDEVTIAAWRNITIPLDTYLGQTIYIAFLYSADDGPRWFIDDISIQHFAGYVDIQPTTITPKSGDYAHLTATEQIKTKIKNNGGSSASGFNLKLFHNGNLIATEPFSGSIPSLGEASHTFNATLNLSASGMHKVQVVTNLIGDQTPANDTATVMINHLGCPIITTFPLEEGFENNGTNLPPCWTNEYVKGNQIWRVFDAPGANSIPGLEPREPFEGNYKAVLYANGSGPITKLITPPLNLTTLNNPVLKFYHIQQRYVNDQDSLKIYYRTSTHGEWVFLEKYTEMITEWTERTIPLPEPSNQYYIAFEGHLGWGHSVQLDNVYIGDHFTTDIAVKDIVPKGVHVGLSPQQAVTTTIKNNGRTAVTGFDVTLYLNETFVAKEVFTSILPALDEVNYTFNAKVDLSVSATYLLTVAVDLEGDEFPDNDELTVTVKNLVCDALTFPYDEGFEEDIFPPHCWKLAGTEWDRQTYSAHTGIGRARHKWWDGRAQDGWLISPKFSIPQNGNYMLEFWSHVYDKKFFTYSGIWISTTNTNIPSFIEEHSLYGDEIPDEIWKKIEVPLNKYAGKDIYIAFRYKNNGGQSGHIWSVDDIKVFNLDKHIDAEVIEITAPPSLGINLTNAETVSVRIKNNGGDNISGFQLKLECNGSVIATENYIGFIPSLVTGNFTFNAKLDLSASGKHSVKVTVILPGDMVPENDSKVKIVENRICPPVTDYPWHGEFQGVAPGEIDDCWTNIDADGDTKKWWSLESNGQFYAISESYDAVFEFPLTPDNWLLTPPLSLAQSEDYQLTYKIGGATSQTTSAEKYSILISKTGINPANFTPVRTETLYPSDYTELLTGALSGYGLKTVKVPLTTYSGETIYIAFRHWDCTAQDRLILTDIYVNNFLHNIENIPDKTPFTAWINNDRLYVEGLNVSDNLSVYTVVGQLVYQNVATSETMIIDLNTRGIYIVQSGNRVVKVVY